MNILSMNREEMFRLIPDTGTAGLIWQTATVTVAAD
jgi:hypothetical protein